MLESQEARRLGGREARKPGGVEAWRLKKVINHPFL